MPEQEEMIVEVFHHDTAVENLEKMEKRDLEQDFQSALKDKRRYEADRYVLGYIDEYPPESFDAGDYPVFLDCDKVYLLCC